MKFILPSSLRPALGRGKFLAKVFSLLLEFGELFSKHKKGVLDFAKSPLSFKDL
jgi:hypothetical protein